MLLRVHLVLLCLAKHPVQLGNDELTPLREHQVVRLHFVEGDILQGLL